MSGETISLGHYIFSRIKQIGVKTIFGLPGDFNLALLDKLYETDGLRWAGSSNELNAAYAADGYSRVNGFGVLVTTFGVGELSALNGVAGAYAEHVAMLHIVGVPSSAAQQKKLLLHHTLGNTDFEAYHRMSAQISETTAMLRDAGSAPSEIDRCIRTAAVAKRPVYLGIPANLVDAMVPASLLDTPIDLDPPQSVPDSEAEVVETVLSMISKAERPVILSDACAGRHNVTAEVRALVDATQFRAFATPLGKGTINEGHPRFGGVYVGTLSQPGVKEAVESADLVISVGAVLSDFNTGSFSYAYQTRNVVELHSTYVRIRTALFTDVHMKSVLRKVIQQVASHLPDVPPCPLPPPPAAVATPAADTPLSQEWLWSNAVGAFLREGDIVITETGTSGFGINGTRFPNRVLGINQVLYGSIGYSVGAAVGASFAAEELQKGQAQSEPRRVILFVGDGSLQLTVQEISCLIRWGLCPYIFVLNNNGYTIERLIRGPTAQYNDIQGWRHQQILSTFGADESNSQSFGVRTVGDWNALAKDAAFGINDKIRLIELFLPQMDAPPSLIAQAQLTSKTNAE